MKVLLSVHHRLDPDQGAPGATLALGGALIDAGCDVEYLAYDHVFGALERERVSHQVSFPWRAVAYLARRAGRFDVIDASTGDAWLWASLGRPGGRRTALVTRAHGLEHLAAERARSAARERGESLSWKYPLYHGGVRLREVGRSLRLSDHCVLLNPGDRDYVRDRLGVAPERLSVIHNGVPDYFHELPPAEPVEGPLRLAFLGRWSDDKGAPTVVDALTGLAGSGVDVKLTVLGTLGDPAEVLADVPDALRSSVSVVPRFPNKRLPELLAGHELFVFPSRSEGSSGALVEAMACGLAPVATPVGGAPEVVTDGAGVLVDAAGIPEAVARLAQDRDALLQMRTRAQRAASRYRWSDVAARTIGVYERAVAVRSTTSRKRAPAADQL